MGFSKHFRFSVQNKMSTKTLLSSKIHGKKSGFARFHTCQLSRIERETHTFPTLPHAIFKHFISHAFLIFEKKFPWFPEFWQKKSLIFQFRNKYFPDFPIFGKKLPRFSEKKFPWFSDFQKKVSPISDFGKSRNRAKISNFASKFLSHTKRTS